MAERTSRATHFWPLVFGAVMFSTSVKTLVESSNSSRTKVVPAKKPAYKVCESARARAANAARVTVEAPRMMAIKRLG